MFVRYKNHKINIKQILRLINLISKKEEISKTENEKNLVKNENRFLKTQNPETYIQKEIESQEMLNPFKS